MLHGYYNRSSALDLEAPSQTFLLGGVTTSRFHVSLQKPHQLATAEVLDADEPRLQQLTNQEQNVQAEPTTTITISQSKRQWAWYAR